MNFGSDLAVYLYEMRIEPNLITDNFINYCVVKCLRKKLEMILGIYAPSGKNIFTTTDLNESIMMECNIKN